MWTCFFRTKTSLENWNSQTSPKYVTLNTLRQITQGSADRGLRTVLLNYMVSLA